ncbi:hypothetical protein [Nocardia bovistercoris]|uniref:Uncharacterized protein n=1 Tax=Nocardia bovistercoris TaxID=2785916 RepID=A0A931IC23_9NOCA|nr:hypothetical protein [Nocardia bovistercoris]MBH0778644.1 hypothetical protein [Nocardia bovistercoris]
MARVRMAFGDGVSTIAPAGAPSVLDAECGVDVLVLEVLGGHLTWNLLSPQHLPAAVVDDLDAAGEWLWAVFGEQVAVAADERWTGDLDAESTLPELVTDARRLAYAHWAARWWPASVIDGIAALDPRLLESDIATLTERCELLVDGADAELPVLLPTTSVARQSDYALAAGGEQADGLIVARGVGGWDWRGCPPGLVDASERSVSWEVVRESGTTLVTVRAAAAPEVGSPVPTHLRPRAALGVDGSTRAEIDLTLVGDAWVGGGKVPMDTVGTVDIRVPGVGKTGVTAAADDATVRQHLRDLARVRLARAADTDATGFDTPLLAEIAAATSDEDF